MVAPSRRTGLSQRRKKSSFFDAPTQPATATGSSARARTSAWSGGRNRAQTASESAAALKVGDTTDEWHASPGVVSEMAYATHSSGSR